MIPILGRGPALGWQDDLWLVARAGLGPTLLLSALAKTSSRGSFDDALSHYRMLPYRLAPVVGPTVIVIEATLALALVTGYDVASALFASACLLTIFAIAMTVNLLVGERSPCGCGTSQNENPISWWRVAANLGISALILSLVLTTAPVEPPSLMATLTVLGIGFSAQLWLNIRRIERQVPRYIQRHLIRQAERYLTRLRDAELSGARSQKHILPHPAHQGTGPGQTPRSHT